MFLSLCVCLCVCAYVCVFPPSAGITAREFIESRVDERSRQDMFRSFLSEHLSIRSGTINVFSLTDVRPKTLDVRFSVHSDGYLRPEKLHGYLAAHIKKVHASMFSHLEDRDLSSYISRCRAWCCRYCFFIS